MHYSSSMSLENYLLIGIPTLQIIERVTLAYIIQLEVSE
jgi:hypothetical protein